MEGLRAEAAFRRVIGEKRDDVRVRGVGGARWSDEERVWMGRVGVVVDGLGEGGVFIVLGDTTGAGVRRVGRDVGGGVGGAFSSSCVVVRVRLDAGGMMNRVEEDGMESKNERVLTDEKVSRGRRG